MGAAELRGLPLEADSYGTALHHTLQGLSVPVQDCRAATAASEVAAIADGDDASTRAVHCVHPNQPGERRCLR
jgi:hypothetical protein